MIGDLKTHLFSRIVHGMIHRTLQDRQHLVAPQADHVMPMDTSHQLKESMTVIAQQRPLHAATTDKFVQRTVDRGQRHARHGRIHALEDVFCGQWIAGLPKDLKD